MELMKCILFYKRNAENNIPVLIIQYVKSFYLASVGKYSFIQRIFGDSKAFRILVILIKIMLYS